MQRQSSRQTLEDDDELLSLCLHPQLDSAHAPALASIIGKSPMPVHGSDNSHNGNGSPGGDSSSHRSGGGGSGPVLHSPTAVRPASVLNKSNSSPSVSSSTNNVASASSDSGVDLLSPTAFPKVAPRDNTSSSVSRMMHQENNTTTTSHHASPGIGGDGGNNSRTASGHHHHHDHHDGGARAGDDDDALSPSVARHMEHRQQHPLLGSGELSPPAASGSTATALPTVSTPRGQVSQSQSQLAAGEVVVATSSSSSASHGQQQQQQQAGISNNAAANSNDNSLNVHEIVAHFSPLRDGATSATLSGHDSPQTGRAAPIPNFDDVSRWVNGSKGSSFATGGGGGAVDDKNIWSSPGALSDGGGALLQTPQINALSPGATPTRRANAFGGVLASPAFGVSGGGVGSSGGSTAVPPPLNINPSAAPFIPFSATAAAAGGAHQQQQSSQTTLAGQPTSLFGGASTATTNNRSSAGTTPLQSGPQTPASHPHRSTTGAATATMLLGGVDSTLPSHHHHAAPPAPLPSLGGGRGGGGAGAGVPAALAAAGGGGGGRGSGSVSPAPLQLESVIGRVVEAARDQGTCRQLQMVLNQPWQSDDVQKVVQEVHAGLPNLMVDQYGNFLAQKLLEVAPSEIRLQYLRSLVPHLGLIAMTQHGTFAVQKLIESLRNNTECEIMCSGVASNVAAVSDDNHGAHVIHKILQCMSPPQRAVLMQSIGENAEKISTMRHGCCVMQKCLNAASPEEFFNFADRIVPLTETLASHQFGNYVVQCLVSVAANYNAAPVLDRILLSLARGPEVMSRMIVDQCSSKAFERAMQSCSIQVFSQLAQSFVELHQHLGHFCADGVGNFVVQAFLSRVASILNASANSVGEGGRPSPFLDATQLQTFTHALGSFRDVLLDIQSVSPPGSRHSYVRKVEQKFDLAINALHRHGVTAVPALPHHHHHQQQHHHGGGGNFHPPHHQQQHHHGGGFMHQQQQQQYGGSGAGGGGGGGGGFSPQSFSSPPRHTPPHQQHQGSYQQQQQFGSSNINNNQPLLNDVVTPNRSPGGFTVSSASADANKYTTTAGGAETSNAPLLSSPAPAGTSPASGMRGLFAVTAIPLPASQQQQQQQQQHHHVDPLTSTTSSSGGGQQIGANTPPSGSRSRGESPSAASNLGSFTVSSTPPPTPQPAGSSSNSSPGGHYHHQQQRHQHQHQQQPQSMPIAGLSSPGSAAGGGGSTAGTTPDRADRMRGRFSHNTTPQRDGGGWQQQQQHQQHDGAVSGVPSFPPLSNVAGANTTAISGNSSLSTTPRGGAGGGLPGQPVPLSSSSNPRNAPPSYAKR